GAGGEHDAGGRGTEDESGQEAYGKASHDASPVVARRTTEKASGAPRTRRPLATAHRLLGAGLAGGRDVLQRSDVDLVGPGGRRGRRLLTRHGALDLDLVAHVLLEVHAAGSGQLVGAGRGRSLLAGCVRQLVLARGPGRLAETARDRHRVLLALL